jgi:uncharacterized protein DUF3307
MIYILLLVYQIKHFVCDFPLQTEYMLGKFKKYPDFILPLLEHSATHALATFLIASVVKPGSAFWLAMLDMTVHFIVDRIKASPNLGGRFRPLDKIGMANCLQLLKGVPLSTIYPLETPKEELRPWLEFTALRDVKSNTYFWWALGADQFAHHITHYFIIWRLLS